MSGRGRNNYRGGGGGRSGGGGGRGRGGGRNTNNNQNSSRGSGGRGGGSYPNKNAYLQTCRDFTVSGNCPRGNNCSFGHFVRLYRIADASSPQTGKYANRGNHGLKSGAFWDNNGQMQVFTGGDDGFWRLWNPANNFAKAAEQNMNGPIECLKVVSNHLFCAFEGPVAGLPHAKAGQVHAWNLANPAAPPLELHMGPAPYAYAHNIKVTALEIIGTTNPPQIITGCADGTIRLWSMGAPPAPQSPQQPPQSTPGFTCQKTLPGHAGEVTGLCMIPGGSLLWSSSQDGTIRIWDVAVPDANAALKHTITAETPNGHTGAVLALVPIRMDDGKTYIISGSIDSHIKVWDASNGTMMVDENQGEGVISLAVTTTAGGTQVLLVGSTKGNISLRLIKAHNKLSAFQLLCTVPTAMTGHSPNPIKDLVPGSSGTFYAMGADGKMSAFHLPNEFEIFIA